MAKIALPLIVLLAVSTGWAQAEVTVRLYAIEAPQQARVVPGKGECGVRACATCRGRPVTAALALRPGMRLRGACIVEVPGRERLQLRWPLTITRRFALLLRMPLEDYVAGVLAGEGSIFRSEESLKAMAVTARTYAVRNRGRHRDEGSDFCDTTHCQDLRLSAMSERLRAATSATESETLWFQGSPAYAFYHRHCGGMTESAANVWPGMSAPYLRSQPDTFCLARGRSEWRAQIPAADMQRALALPRAGEIAVMRRSYSGRALEVSVNGTRMSVDKFHLAIGRALGWNLLRSASFEVAPANDGFAFQGHGSGHGVGLCQTGAAERGERGHTYRQILDFYYPGTVLGVNAQGFTWQRAGGERVDVESTRLAQDDPVAGIAGRALREAERRAGFPLDFRPRLRVYPSVAAFRDATGEPGWVAASTLGRTVRIQPLAVLRLRGVLKPVLLHEMLHLLIESRAHPGTPDWFREGLALHLAASIEGSALRPAGGEEARTRQAYQRARACVERLEKANGRAAVFQWLHRGLPPHNSSCAP